jgi:hypothetical protein
MLIAHLLLLGENAEYQYLVQSLYRPRRESQARIVNKLLEEQKLTYSPVSQNYGKASQNTDFAAYGVG